MPVTQNQINEAAEKLAKIITKSPLQYSKRLSKKYNAEVYIKREDLHEVRSFKIRGAYNKIASFSKAQLEKGIVTASTGNHAQGVAYSCALLGIKGVIFMPRVTPTQKFDKVAHFGGKNVTIKLVGETFDEAVQASRNYCEKHGAKYIHPFDDPATIAGQGTIGKEIYEELGGNVDVVLAPIGGGGIVSGIATYLKENNAFIKVYGVEAAGAASMHQSLVNNKIVSLGKFDTFVDGAAVNRVGELTFRICKKYLEKVLVTPVGSVCTTMIELYQSDGIIAEPAGALSIAALELIKDKIQGKRVVCVLSGGNNDILRYPDIMEKSLVYLGRKHYFIIEFAQKPGQLRAFLDKALGPTDDIVFFEYMKKTNREKGPAFVGIELKDKHDLSPLMKKMEAMQLKYQQIDNNDMMYNLLI